MLLFDVKLAIFDHLRNIIFGLLHVNLIESRVDLSKDRVSVKSSYMHEITLTYSQEFRPSFRTGPQMHLIFE